MVILFTDPLQKKKGREWGKVISIVCCKARADPTASYIYGDVRPCSGNENLVIYL